MRPILPVCISISRRWGLPSKGLGTITDITACPGTDTCKLGIASSRGLAAELKSDFEAHTGDLAQAVEGLRIKTSGCFNSCGQHQIADLGFYGVSRTVDGYSVPHFQVVLGGKWVDNGGAYGLAIGAVPSKRIPEAVQRITRRFVAERQPDESFQSFTESVGKRSLKETIEDLTVVPAHDSDPSFYSDWGDPREFTLGDMGVGECAGEVVSLAEFDLAAAEAQVFEAQLELEDGHYEHADELAYDAMLLAAKGLIKTEFVDITDESSDIVREFKTRFFDTERFFDRYAGGKFAMYLFRRHEATKRARHGRGCATADRGSPALSGSQPCLPAAARRRQHIWQPCPAVRRRRLPRPLFMSITPRGAAPVRRSRSSSSRARPDPSLCIPIFHRWIRERALGRAVDRRGGLYASGRRPERPARRARGQPVARLLRSEGRPVLHPETSQLSRLPDACSPAPRESLFTACQLLEDDPAVFEAAMYDFRETSSSSFPTTASSHPR